MPYLYRRSYSILISQMGNMQRPFKGERKKYFRAAGFWDVACLINLAHFFGVSVQEFQLEKYLYGHRRQFLLGPFSVFQEGGADGSNGHCSLRGTVFTNGNMHRGNVLQGQQLHGSNLSLKYIYNFTQWHNTNWKEKLDGSWITVDWKRNATGSEM